MGLETRWSREGKMKDKFRVWVQKTSLNQLPSQPTRGHWGLRRLPLQSAASRSFSCLAPFPPVVLSAFPWLSHFRPSCASCPSFRTLTRFHWWRGWEGACPYSGTCPQLPLKKFVPRPAQLTVEMDFINLPVLIQQPRLVFREHNNAFSCPLESESALSVAKPRLEIIGEVSPSLGIGPGQVWTEKST